MPTKRGPEPVQIEDHVRDAWLRTATPRGPRTWAELNRQFRAFLPAVQSKTLCATLQQWGASPEDLEPLLRLVRAIVFSNAVYRAALTRATWAAGTARDPHHKLTPEKPGALRPLLELLERVIAELEQLIQWEFTPPIVRHAQTDAPYARGRLVITPLGDGRFTVEVTRGASKWAIRAGPSMGRCSISRPSRASVTGRRDSLASTRGVRERSLDGGRSRCGSTRTEIPFVREWSK